MTDIRLTAMANSLANTPQQLAIVSVRKIYRISIDRIECCNGADDYT